MRRQAGFGLIEILLAAALGALLLAAAAAVYGSAARLNAAAKTQLQRQHEWRDFWQFLADDLRQAGAFGCFYQAQPWTAQSGFSDGLPAWSGQVLGAAYGQGSAVWGRDKRWHTTSADGSAAVAGGAWLAADCGGIRAQDVPQWQRSTTDGSLTAAGRPSENGANDAMLLRRKQVYYGIAEQDGRRGLYRSQSEGGARLMLSEARSWRWQTGFAVCENGQASAWQSEETAGGAAWLLVEVTAEEDGQTVRRYGTVALRGGGLCRE